MHDAISNPTSINGEGNWHNQPEEGSQLLIISAQMIDGEAQTLNDSSNKMMYIYSPGPYIWQLPTIWKTEMVRQK